MINQSLIEMKDEISDLIITSSNFGDKAIYWDTLYNPYCYQLNMLSDTVFEAPKPRQTIN